MEEVVELREVTVRYGTEIGGVTALESVSLRIGAGEFVAVMGATGSGKSTLLSCAAGLERPTQGSVRLLGAEAAAMSEGELSRMRRRRVGFVFQSFNLLSELSVAQNVLLPCRLGARAALGLRDVLAAVGLAGLEQRPVGALSGGQRQRVAIARALITGPAVIFADEPTGALDPTTGGHIMDLLRHAVDSAGVALVMVSHDPVVAAVSDRLVLLRAGRVVADTRTPEAAAIVERLRGVSQSADPWSTPARVS